VKRPSSVLLVVASLLLLLGCESAEEKLDRYAKNAQNHFEEEEYDAAHIEYSNALQIDSNDIESLYGVSRVFIKLGDPQKTYRYLKRVLELQPTHVKAIIDIGTLELAGGQVDAALDRSSLALDLAAGSASAHAFRSATLYKAGDIAGATKEAEKALQLDSINQSARLILASISLDSNNVDKAISYLDQVLSDEPGNVIFQLMKVRALNKINDFDGASEIFTTLVKLFPNKEKFRFALAKQYQVGNEPKRTLETLSIAANRENSSLESKLYYISFLSDFQGQEQAIAELYAFSEKFPEDSDLKFKLADLYLQAKQKEDALTLLSNISDANYPDEISLRAKNRLARIYFRDGDIDAGKKLISDIISVDAKNTEAIITQAKILLLDEKFDVAISNLRSILLDEPNSPEILSLLAYAHTQQGNQALAEDLYAKALQGDPSNRLVNIKYTELLVRSAQHERANTVLERYLKIAPNEVAALKLMAEIKLAKGDWLEAQNIADKLNKSGESDGSSEHIRGLAFKGENDLQASINSFELSYEKSESKARPMASLVKTYLRANRIDEATQFLKTVLKNDPQNLQANILMAQINMAAGDRELSLSQLQRTIEMHPKEMITYRILNLQLLSDKEFTKSLELLQLGLQNNPANLFLQVLKAETYRQSNDLTNTIETYRNALKDNPQSDVVANNLASLLSESSSEELLNEAKVIAERFRDSRVPYFQDTLGWIYYKVGDINNALYFLESAVESLDNPEFNYHLGLAYIASGNTTQAKASLEKATRSQNSSYPGIEAAKDALKAL